MEGLNPVLAQMLGIELDTDTPRKSAAATASPMRKMRLALARAADDAVGLSSSVLGIAEDEADAETLLETAPKGWVVLGLRAADQAGLSGVALLDPTLRSALVDMQTMGNLMPQEEEPRPVTETDSVMCMPFVSALMSELDIVEFVGDDLSFGSYDLCPMPDLRTVGLVMVQGMYRSWRITVDFGGGEAQGEILLALRPPVSALPPEAELDAEWTRALRRAVEQAPADLDAVLAKLKMSFRDVEALEVGSLLELPGVTVGSVALVGPDGEMAAPGRLGQVAGKRAVRIEAPDVQLEPVDISPSPAFEPGGGGEPCFAANVALETAALPGDTAMPGELPPIQENEAPAFGDGMAAMPAMIDPLADPPEG